MFNSPQISATKFAWDTVNMLTYYRYDERSGTLVLYKVMETTPFRGTINKAFYKAFFTMKGQPRKTIRVKGKRYFLNENL